MVALLHLQKGKVGTFRVKSSGVRLPGVLRKHMESVEGTCGWQIWAIVVMYLWLLWFEGNIYLCRGCCSHYLEDGVKFVSVCVHACARTCISKIVCVCAHVWNVCVCVLLLRRKWVLGWHQVCGWFLWEHPRLVQMPLWQGLPPAARQWHMPG